MHIKAHPKIRYREARFDAVLTRYHNILRWKGGGIMMVYVGGGIVMIYAGGGQFQGGVRSMALVSIVASRWDNI